MSISELRRAPVFVSAMLLATSLWGATTSPSVTAEVDVLLDRLEVSDCRFNRNGTWYGAKDAKAHLLRKLKRAGALPDTESFIELVASGSGISGQPYLVSCEGSTTIESREWLTEKLSEIRARESEH